MGELHITGIAGEIHAVEGNGEITVQLPDGIYAIDAKSKLGAVNSDFPGTDRRAKWWVVAWPGHTFTASPSSPSQKIFLRAGYGDIVVLKIH